MKQIFLIALIAVSSSAFAQDVVVKECSVTMKVLDSNETVDMTLKVIAKDDQSLEASVTEITDGTPSTYTDVASVSEESVRAGLSSQSDLEGLNQAEGLIVHAMSISEDPVLQTIFSAGIDLTQVRSAKVYLIGEATNMGATAIVEAKDANNKVLGSFLGGFLVSPCK